MKNLLKPFAGILILIALMGCANTQAVRQSSHISEAPALTSVRVDNNSLVIQSNKQFTYTLYQSDDPYRAVLEIPDMKAGPFTDRIASDSGLITEVVPQQIDSPILMTRLDIVLQSPLSLIPVYSDRTLVLSIRKDDPNIISEIKKTDPEPGPLARLVSAEVPAVQQAASGTSRATEVNSININKAVDVVKVLISGNGAMIPNVFPVNERIVVDIPEVALRAELPSQTPSPLKSIRAGRHKDKLRIVLDLKEKTNFDVMAIGNAIEISLMSRESAPPKSLSSPSVRESEALASPAATPVAPAAASEAAISRKDVMTPAPLTDGVYTGKRISLDFQDADIIPIFRLLGDISGYNMVINPEVKGKITLNLSNVPWDQAMDIIMRTFTLSKIVEGNIIRILPTSAVAKELDSLKNTKKAEAEAGDLRTKIFYVNYAELSKLTAAIDKAKLLSSRGSLSLDERGSSIIINDLDANLEKVGALIKEIDQEHMQARQVMIEAKIVEVTSTYTKDLGIQWGAFYTRASDQGVSTLGSAGRTSTAAAPNYLVNLPAAGTAANIGFGFLNRAGTFALDLKLSAMEQMLKGKVISNPKIITMNNEEATITQGSTIYIESTAAGASTPGFTAVNALLSLRVKPRIAPGGAIFMDLDIAKDQPGPLVGSNVSILKNTAKTSVLVNDQDTIVIGGIYKKSENVTDDNIPGLSKLPFIGKLLFNREKNVEESTEILIFITPRILDYSSMK